MKIRATLQSLTFNYDTGDTMPGNTFDVETESSNEDDWMGEKPVEAMVFQEYQSHSIPESGSDTTKSEIRITMLSLSIEGRDVSKEELDLEYGYWKLSEGDDSVKWIYTRKEILVQPFEGNQTKAAVIVQLEKEAENWIAYIYACGFEGSGNFGEWCGKYGLDEFMEGVENTIFEGSMEELWDEPEGVSARDNGLFNSLSKYIHEKYLEDNEGVILVQDWVLDEVGPKGFFEENFNWDCGLVPHASSTWSLRANYKSEV